MVPWAVLDSYAWGQLTNAARITYIALLRKKNRPGQEEIVLTCDEGERLMSRHTFLKAIEQLLEWDFIMMRQRGGEKRRTNIYMLSEGWRYRSEQKK
jgi:hypothetical protein